MAERTEPPAWPSRVEAVEIAKLDLKPGDTLIVKAKDGTEFTPAVGEELREFLKYYWPDVEILVIGLPLDLEVRPAATGADWQPLREAVARMDAEGGA